MHPVCPPRTNNGAKLAMGAGPRRSASSRKGPVTTFKADDGWPPLVPLEPALAFAKSMLAKARMGLVDRAPVVSGALRSMLLFRGCGDEDLRLLPPVSFHSWI